MPDDDEGGRAPARPAGGGGFSFTRKLGPAPVWMWMLGGLAGAVLLSTWRKNKTAATPPAGATTGGTPQSTQTPPFIIQNYPGQTVQGPSGPAGPAGATGPAGAPGGIIPVQGGQPPGFGTGNWLPIPVSAVNGGMGTPPPATAPPATPPPPPPPAQTPAPPRQPLEYRVKPGDSLSAIAARYGLNWWDVWNYNLNPANGRPQSTIDILKRRGPNTLYTNELILIPQ